VYTITNRLHVYKITRYRYTHEYGSNGEIMCSKIKHLLQFITQRQIFAT